ncbi:MAG: hypothetical protein L0Y44_09300 [Phycisphaerales bacterium]|nr:hypothetical protein [Phycisphaerales bacterium]
MIAHGDQFDQVLTEALLEKLRREGQALSEALDNLKVLMVHRHQAEQEFEAARTDSPPSPSNGRGER